MTDLIDIARSGLSAYRGALAATGENIANATTEGYLRRDVSIVPLGGARATAATQATGGQGALLAEVRRAFDGLAAARLRDTTGAAEAAQAHGDAAQAIERLMLPGEQGVDGVLRGFFDALADLAAGPTDGTVRARVLQAGDEVAGTLSGLAQGLWDLRADMAARAGEAAGKAMGLLHELAGVARQMAGQGHGFAQGGGMHALADRRDTLLGALSRLLPVAVQLDAAGVPVVRLGHAGGPLLLQGAQVAALSVSVDDQLTMTVNTADGRTATTRSIGSGEIGGLARGLGALDMAVQELDGFARKLAGAANALHRRGVDLAGRAGGDLFRLQGWETLAAASNGGITRVTFEPAGVAGTTELTLTYDAAASVWRARDPGDNEVASGADTLVIGELTVRLDGAPADGDRITLTPVAGRARDLTFVVPDPAALAAAAPFATVPSASNTGSATAGVRMAEPPAEGPGPLGEVTGAGTVDLPGGVVGVIPAGTETVALQSWGRLAAASVAFPAGALRLVLDLDGDMAAFDLQDMPDAAAAVAALQSGTLRSDTGRSLASLGLLAEEGTGGTLRLVRPGAEAPPGVTVEATGGPVAGTGEAGAAAGGSIQVITRNGRHVAGTPLSAAEAAALLTPANGFLPGAVYDPSPLSGSGYRGMAVAAGATSGVQGLRLDIGGMTAGLSLPETAARSLDVSDAAGARATVELPAAASAALAASRLNAAVPGLSARASTALELSALPDGMIGFDLVGPDGVARQVAAPVTGGDGAALAQAVNALAARSGVRAEVSPDGARVLLVQDAGEDIVLSGLSLPTGSLMRATPTGTDGTPRGAPVDLAAGMALRQGGTVDLTAPQGFAVGEGTGLAASAPGADGPVRVRTARAGAEATLRFPATPAGPDGALAFRLTSGSTQAEVAVPAGLQPAEVAAAVAAALRERAPAAEVTGAPLVALPPEGAALGLMVDGRAYTLRMAGGQPVVTGPEAGRVTAAFDAANRLVLRAEGVTDGRGIIAAEAPVFGLGAGEGRMVLSGQPPLATGLPATVAVEIDGTPWAVTLETGGVTVPTGFPGTAEVDAGSGALRLGFAVPGVGVRVREAQDAGFGGPGAVVHVTGDTVVLQGDSGPLGVAVAASGAPGQRVQLDGLPPEDLVVAMTGSGTLRLSADLGPVTPPDDPGNLEIVVTDAGAGALALRDAATGETIAEGRLDAQGTARLGGVEVQLAGRATTGDRFRVVPATAGSADAAVARELAALRREDPATGSPGMAERLARLQSDAGVRAAAARRAAETAATAAEAAERQVAALGAVDLDAEAARLVELQQGYQANAQAIAVARSLFDTLLGLF